MRTKNYLAGCAILAIAGTGAAAALEREQLPSGVIPLSYDLLLAPDAVNLQFHGQVRIAVEVKASTSSIVLNADELVLEKAALDSTETATAIALDTKLQRATLTFGRPIAVGSHTVSIDYHGVIGRSTHGFFAMDDDSPSGKRRTIATNFEAAYERRFMPSWDEPGLKATLSLSVDLPADRVAISNMPIASSEALPDGKKRVRFARTPKMSTYLYFLGIGDFERISTKVDGTDVGVVVNRGDTERGRYALGEAIRLLHYYNDYFGVPYPLPKLDLVAVPGQISGMENWGAILFGLNGLLFDPRSSTEEERDGVFLTVAHELSHQWFGDLVTMAWWDDLWLNEGFAQWMQSKAAGELHPEWKPGLQALFGFEGGKSADAKPAPHPIVQTVLNVSQAVQAFDAITYRKGAAVIGMLEAYVGPNAFRDGVRRYMRRYAYGNTVDADFWREVQAVARKPLLEMEADFTRQPGLPLLRVEAEQLGSGQTKLVLSQGQFAEEPSSISSAPVQTWHIPVQVSAGGELATYLVSGADATVVTVQGKDPIIVNAGQSAYVRTLYPGSMIRALTSTIGAAKTVDQVGLLFDSWALGQAGYAPVTHYLDLARSIPIHADPEVWIQVEIALVSIARHYRGEPGHTAFLAFARDRLRPLAARLGWEAQPGDEVAVAVLRDSVLRNLSAYGEQAVRAEADRRFEMAMRNPKDVSPAVRRTALAITARNADAATLDRLIAMARATHDPLEKRNLFMTLARIADPSGAERVLDLAVGPDPPPGIASVMISIASLNHPDLAWDRALQYVNRSDASLDAGQRSSLVCSVAANSSDRKRAADLQTYADQHIPASERRSVVEAIATINQNAKFKAERLPEIDRWLASQAGH